MSGPAALTPPRSRRPLLLAIAVLWAIVGALLAVSLSLTGGQVTLALDDAYIHLAMAKNFALHGVWGVTRHAFSSASSSPLWTLTMATLFKLLGPHPVLALVVNLILGTVLVVAVDRFLAVRHPDVSDRWRAGAALAVALVTPVPTMVLIGMEHTAAALFTIVFAHLVASELALADPRRTVAPATLLSGALVTTIRYEGLFLVAAACLLYALRRRVRGAVLLAATALAPLVAYGAVSAAASWDWLPATVLLKGKRPAILDDSGQVSAPRIATTWLRTVATTTRRLVEALGYSSYSSIVGQPPLLALVAIALVAWFARASRGPW
ncbi:MAG: hypothetical protein HY815_14515 [Candidatus Riflebacteria bacterium]|nr:hypothetical protein [Candidatus Riflebacteria bacterium]